MNSIYNKVNTCCSCSMSLSRIVSFREATEYIKPTKNDGIVYWFIVKSYFYAENDF